MTPLLEVRGLCAGYGGSRVLHELSFTIGRGEAVALLGRNGMGKTTTLRALMGLLVPAAGTITIAGHKAAGLPPHRIARLGLALVPEGRGIFPDLSVRENLVMAARPGAWTLERVLALFPRLAERLSSRGDRLSGGEQQMLAIGRALLTNPHLLLLDEATEGLAPLVRRDIWRVIAEIRAAGIATLVVDKDLAALLALCDRALIMARGALVFDGSTAALGAAPRLVEEHLGV